MTGDEFYYVDSLGRPWSLDPTDDQLAALWAGAAAQIATAPEAMADRLRDGRGRAALLASVSTAIPRGEAGEADLVLPTWLAGESEGVSEAVITFLDVLRTARADDPTFGLLCEAIEMCVFDADPILAARAAEVYLGTAAVQF